MDVDINHFRLDKIYKDYKSLTGFTGFTGFVLSFECCAKTQKTKPKSRVNHV
jgi:hypothetical protein